MVTKTIIDQLSLVNIGMFAICDTTREFWTHSFDSCNLDPHTRVSFGDWCERIGHFLQAGESFVPESFDTNPKAEEIYAMLPSWWHDMPPNEKQAVAAIAEAHDRTFCVVRIHQIHQVCSIPMKEMQNMCMCMEWAW
jgi:hypothetical protein